MSFPNILELHSYEMCSSEEYKEFPEHRQLTKRLCKTLYYGRNPSTERPSLPMTKIAVEFLQDAAPRELGRVDLSYASFVSRRSCMSPCSMMLGMLYIERLKCRQSKYLQDISSSDLFLISMMMASKFLYDEGVDEEVFNDEWAESAKMDKEELNELERNFLSAIDWQLFVRQTEFHKMLLKMEKRIAMGQALDRGWFSYTDLCVLMEDIDYGQIFTSLWQELCKMMMVCSVAYVASLATMLCSTALASAINSSLVTLTNTKSTTSGSDNLIPSQLDMDSRIPVLDDQDVLILGMESPDDVETDREYNWIKDYVNPTVCVLPESRSLTTGGHWTTLCKLGHCPPHARHKNCHNVTVNLNPSDLDLINRHQTSDSVYQDVLTNTQCCCQPRNILSNFGDIRQPIHNGFLGFTTSVPLA